MDWIRENKPLAVIIGVVLAVSAGLGYMLFNAWSRFETSKETYLGLGSQIAGLNSAPLAPTEANVTIKKKAVDEYAAKVNQLGGALLLVQSQLAPVKDIEFQAKLKSKIADARKAAGTFKMSLPGEFAFGFDEYTTRLPKSAEAASELSNYLDATDELLKLLMKCGVASVDLFERSQLPVEQAQAPAPGTASNARLAPAAILTKRQVSLILTLDQGPLQLLISRLANPSEMPFFTNVRLVRIENQRIDGPLRAEVQLPETPGTESGGVGVGTSEPGQPVATDVIKFPDPAPKDSVPVIGEEMLKVQLEIDFLRFNEAAKGVVATPGR